MVLSERDGQLFYQLWFPLLDFVNQRYGINKKLKNITNARYLNPTEVKEVADFLWSHTGEIDDYLEKCASEIPEEHKQIIASWKNCLTGKFIMERHLKKGSIFISGETENVYQVQGIISSLEELFSDIPLPILMEATLIPFRDVIISDGLVAAYPIAIGRNMAKQFKDIYMDAKNNKEIIRSLKENQMEAFAKKTKKVTISWLTFQKLQSRCYENLIESEGDDSYWLQAFDLMKDLVLEERKKNPNYAPCLELLDDVTDYEYDIQGWVEDCLDEIDMSGDFETVLKMCEDLLTIFAWPGYTGSNIKFRKVATLGVLGRKDEVQEYSKNWLQEEPQNIMAATAGVYVNMDARNWEEAEALVKRFIKKDTKCTPENDSMFVAASRLYQLMGKKREQKKVEKEIMKYEERLEQYFMGGDFDEDDDYDLDYFNEELPFD